MNMSWSETRREVARQLAAAGIVPVETEARFMVEEVSGYGASEWPGIADTEPTDRARRRLTALVARRAAGEPLQYVLGSWSFRGLDLMVDRRVLIPRPETEQVVEVALDEAQRRGLRRVTRRPALVDDRPTANVADLGTGSGAIALALEAELPDVLVWATDVSADALDVARANIAGCAAARVRTSVGSWFDALPPELRGRFELIVSNPPYISEGEVVDLPEEVVAFEPRAALVSGATGCEALEYLLDHGREWLVANGVLVCEIAPHQSDAMVEHARNVGYVDAFVQPDLAGRARVLVARAG
jgi:release factor glutamine methyltransferase